MLCCLTSNTLSSCKISEVQVWSCWGDPLSSQTTLLPQVTWAWRVTWAHRQWCPKAGCLDGHEPSVLHFLSCCFTMLCNLGVKLPWQFYFKAYAKHQLTGFRLGCSLAYLGVWPWALSVLDAIAPCFWGWHSLLPALPCQSGPTRTAAPAACPWVGIPAPATLSCASALVCVSWGVCLSPVPLFRLVSAACVLVGKSVLSVTVAYWQHMHTFPFSFSYFGATLATRLKISLSPLISISALQPSLSVLFKKCWVI